MSNIKICRSHGLEASECRAVAEDLLGRLVNKFGGNFKQSGDNFHYRHPSGVKAQIAMQASELTVDVKLGVMTRSFAPQMETAINEVLDEQLGHDG
jgi:putative polyhydroxyalkanoate system protein